MASPNALVRILSAHRRTLTRYRGSWLGLVLAFSCTENPEEHFRANEIEAPGPADDNTGRDDEEDGQESVADASIELDASETDESTTDDTSDGRDPDSNSSSSDAGTSNTPGGRDSGPGSVGAADDDGTDTDESLTDDSSEPSGGAPPLDAGTPTTAPDPSPLPDEESLVSSCGAAPVVDGAFTRSRLRSAAAQCATWHYCRFESFANALDQRVAAHVETPDAANLERARQAWRAAMTNWSAVELFQFGPLASRSDSAGKDMYEGQGIRDLIYAWPTVSRCRVEEQLISQNYASRGLDGALISGRGLYALEYLLFFEGSDTACTGSTQSSWQSLASSELESRKRDYSAALTADILAHIRSLVDLWAPSGGNFTDTFVEAEGEYPDEQEVLKVTAWSLVYLEREVKDWKLGIPAGYTISHPVTTAETPHALNATQNIAANLEGFQRLFQGCGDTGEGIGFDDWLIEAGHGQLAQDMIDALANAREVADDFPPLHAASAEELEELYQAIRALTALLKTEFFGAGSPLNLDLPGGVEGDTD